MIIPPNITGDCATYIALRLWSHKDHGVWLGIEGTSADTDDTLRYSNPVLLGTPAPPLKGVPQMEEPHSFLELHHLPSV